MVVGLLVLAAIPTVTAVAEAIAEKDKPKDDKLEKRQMRKFNLTCWCEGKSKGKSDIHGGTIVLGDGKVCVEQPLYWGTLIHLDVGSVSQGEAGTASISF